MPFGFGGYGASMAYPMGGMNAEPMVQQKGKEREVPLEMDDAAFARAFDDAAAEIAQMEAAAKGTP